MSDELKKFYVHYTVHNNGEPQRLVLGPYNESEVLDKRRDIASYAYVSDCIVSEDATP